MDVTAVILNYSRPDYVKKRSIPHLKKSCERNNNIPWKKRSIF